MRGWGWGRVRDKLIGDTHTPDLIHKVLLHIWNPLEMGLWPPLMPSFEI